MMPVYDKQAVDEKMRAAKVGIKPKKYEKAAIVVFILTVPTKKELPPCIQEALAKSLDQAKYDDAYLKENIGAGIAIQIDSVGEVDVYIIGKEIFNREYHLLDEAVAIDEVPERFRGLDLVKVKKHETTCMILASQAGIAIQEEWTLPQPDWGLDAYQKKEAGVDAYIVVQLDDGVYHAQRMIQVDPMSGLPIAYKELRNHSPATLHNAVAPGDGVAAGSVAYLPNMHC